MKCLTSGYKKKRIAGDYYSYQSIDNIKSRLECYLVVGNNMF